MSTELKAHLSRGTTWKRGLFILLFALIYSVAEVVFWAIVLFQFGSQLITGHSNDALLEFSRGLNAYLYQILQYLSFRSEAMPYPFNDWPLNGRSGKETTDPPHQTPDKQEIDDEQ